MRSGWRPIPHIHRQIPRKPLKTSQLSTEFVVPEPGTIILMLAMFGALTTAYLTRKRIH